MKSLKWSQHYTSIFKTLRAANSKIGDGIWQKFENIQTFIVFLVICKNEEDPFKMKVLEWSQHSSNYKSVRIFLDVQG